MSLDELSLLKNWLLARIEEVGAEEKTNGAARIKQLEEQLREVEAEIALKEKLH
jgi:hypothetical protein